MKTAIFISSLLAIVILQSCCTIKTYKLNEEFEIVLENEGVGGYQWNFIKIPEVIVLDSLSITVSEKDKLDYYKRKFKLKGIKKGKYKLEFHHLRSFEKFDTVPKEHIKTIKIKIKK